LIQEHVLGEMTS